MRMHKLHISGKHWKKDRKKQNQYETEVGQQKLKAILTKCTIYCQNQN